ncbi:MAG: DUF1653 domain-containing protein [Candidatus Paceibacterota bacterium]|jgi:hypothetical protein
MKKLEVGAVYKHYKGTKAKVIGEAFNSETREPMVIYIHLEDGVIWTRPKRMFLENVTVNGKKVERFKKLNQKILIKPGKKQG